MAQTVEYQMFTPHPKAKLFKRLTNDMPVELKNGETITVQNNRYGLLDRNGRKGNANRLHAEARTSVPIYTAFERGVELICNNTTTACECATFL